MFRKGSAVFSGQYDLKEALSIKDPQGLELGNELKRIKYDGASPCMPRPIGAFIETHIEQGPILEKENKRKETQQKKKKKEKKSEEKQRKG